MLCALLKSVSMCCPSRFQRTTGAHRLCVRGIRRKEKKRRQPEEYPYWFYSQEFVKCSPSSTW